MLTKISSRLCPNPKPYIDLFSEQMKTGQKYKAVSGEGIALPEDIRLNTLITDVWDDIGNIQEIVVDYLKNKLILTDEQRNIMSKKLVRQLEKLGENIFAPDSEGNLVDNSSCIWLESNSCFVQDSSKINIIDSDRTIVQDSKKINIEDSPGTIVDNSKRGNVLDSEDSKVYDSLSFGLIDSPYTNIYNSWFVGACSSTKAYMKDSSFSEIVDSLSASLSASRFSRITRSPGAHISRTQNLPHFIPLLYIYFAHTSIVDSPRASLNNCDSSYIEKSPELHASGSPYMLVRENECSQIKNCENIAMYQSPNSKLSNSTMVSVIRSKNTEVSDTNKYMRGTLIEDSPKTKIENNMRENYNPNLFSEIIDACVGSINFAFDKIIHWQIWGNLRKDITVKNSPETTIHNSSFSYIKNSPGSTVLFKPGTKLKNKPNSTVL